MFATYMLLQRDVPYNHTTFCDLHNDIILKNSFDAESLTPCTGLRRTPTSVFMVPLSRSFRVIEYRLTSHEASYLSSCVAFRKY